MYTYKIVIWKKRLRDQNSQESRLHCIGVYADNKDDFHYVILNKCLGVYRGVGEGWRPCGDIWIFSWINEIYSSDFKQYYSAYTGQFFILYYEFNEFELGC